MIIIFIGLYLRNFNKNKIIKQLILYSSIPVFIAWLFAQISPIYHHRYFLFGGMFFIILFAWGFDRIIAKVYFKKIVTCVVILLILGIGALGLPILFKDQTYVVGESANFIMNENKDKTDYAILHTSTFSQTPYKYYFRNYNVTNYLLTNLTTKQLFTAGGSAIKDHEIVGDNFIEEYNETRLYIASDRLIRDVVWESGGLFVSLK